MVHEELRSDLVDSFEETNEADFAYAIEGVGRFRVNAFRQRGTAGLVFRRCQSARLRSPTWNCRRSWRRWRWSRGVWCW